MSSQSRHRRARGVEGIERDQRAEDVYRNAAEPRSEPNQRCWCARRGVALEIESCSEAWSEARERRTGRFGSIDG